MEAAFLVTGLAGIGYVISRHNDKKEGFAAKPVSKSALESLPHGNMAPFLKRDGTQSLREDAYVGTMDRYNGGSNDIYQKKQEVGHLGVVAPDTTTSPFGMPNTSDFMHSRINAPVKAEGTFPVERVYVGPGLGRGYDWKPTGGFHQTDMAEFAQPKDSDDLRVADKVRKTYETEMNPGASRINEPIMRHEELPKNRPDRYYVNGPDRWNTTVGVEKGETLRHDMSATLVDQNRDTTDNTQGRMGPAVAAAAGYRSYIRPVLEPFMTFYKLTVGDYFGGGPGTKVSGPTLYDAWYKMSTNSTKEELAKTRAPTAHGPKTFVGKEDVGKYDLNQDEQLRMQHRLNNGHRENQQGSGRDGLGTVFYRPELPTDAESRRLGDDTVASLRANPYVIDRNTESLRNGM